MALLRTKECNKHADWHKTPAPEYTIGQKVQLSTHYVPLHTESKKLKSTFIRLFEIAALVNPVSVHLNLSHNMKIHNVFHVFQIKSWLSSPLC